jgi:hypothetical protein
MVRDRAETYLSLSSEPGETLIGGSWPCRLFRVEPVGDVATSDEYAHKRCVLAARVVEEAPAHLALGPMGVHVAALIARAKTLTDAEARNLGAPWSAAGYAAWSAAGSAAGYAARYAAESAARYAAESAAWSAAGSAAVALVARGLIGAPGWDQATYDLLTGAWASVIGPAHPDDAPVRATEETQ